MYKLLLGSLASLLVASCSDGGDGDLGAHPGGQGLPVVAASTPPAAEAVSVETRPAQGAPAVEPSPARPPVDLAALVPNNALAYFECASIEALDEALLRFESMTGEVAAITGGVGIAGATIPLVEAGIDPTRVDSRAPIAVVLVPANDGGKPKTTVIVPAIGEAPVFSTVASLSMRGMRAARVPGDYVVVSHVDAAPSPGTGEAEVTTDLPGGFLRGRFDVDVVSPMMASSFFGIAKAMNESYRLSRPRRSAGELYEFDAKRVLDALAGSRQLAFGIGLDGDRATLETRFVDALEVSVDHPIRAKDLGDLAHHMDAEDPISVLATFESGTVLQDAMDAWMRAAGELGFDGGAAAARRIRVPMGQVARELDQMLGSFASGAAVSMQFEPAKAHLAIYLQASGEDDAAREAISLILSKCDLDDWGFEMALPIRSLMDGILVEDYTVRFDTRRLDFDARAEMRDGFKTFLGDSTLHLKVASVGSHVLIIIGGDTTAVNARIRGFREEGLADADVVAALHAARSAESTAVFQADLVRLFSQIAGLTRISAGHSVADAYREVTREVGGGSAKAVGWTGTIGRDRLIGARFDLGALTRAFDAFKGTGL